MTAVTEINCEPPDDDRGALAPLSGLNGRDDEHAPSLVDDRRQFLLRCHGHAPGARRRRSPSRTHRRGTQEPTIGWKPRRPSSM
ncbi:hypothetical protein BE11_25645 [Sorangium cellulosum]|nr:hypothetical protein BE11_25645 [Sorangium cellulosum]